MKHTLLIAGFALAAIAAPAAADPGHGRGHGKDRDRYEDRYDRGDREGRWDRGDRYGYNGRGCPPGLAKKHNGCLPPGQARKLARGQRYMPDYGYRSYSYNTIPYNVRRQYNLNRNYRYYYNDGYLYGVDPTTQIVQSIIQSVLR